MAHGAGLPSSSPWMSQMAQRLESLGVQVVRFNFEYMALSLELGKKRPPPKLEKLMEEFRAAVEPYEPGEIFVGGKSMGGRVASHLAAEIEFAGLVLLGYPFHPPGKPEKLRTEHLPRIRCRTLVCQGERDPFGNRPEIEAMTLPEDFEWCWLCQGNHDFKPPKSAGSSFEDNLQQAAEAVRKFMSG